MSKKVYCPTVVQCNACRWNTSVIGILVKDESDIMTFASAVHKKNGVVCPKPELVVIYTNAVVSNEVYSKTFDVAANNGKGDSGLIVKGNG